MTVIRKDPFTKTKGGGNAFARGRRAIAIDQRTGMKHLRDEMVFEPGTNFIVHRSESDGMHNSITDPLNFPSDKMRQSEGLGLKFTSLDTPLSVGTVVSAVSLVQSDIMQHSFFNYPGTSVTTQEV